MSRQTLRGPRGPTPRCRSRAPRHDRQGSQDSGGRGSRCRERGASHRAPMMRTHSESADASCPTQVILTSTLRRRFGAQPFRPLNQIARLDALIALIVRHPAASTIMLRFAHERATNGWRMTKTKRVFISRSSTLPGSITSVAHAGAITPDSRNVGRRLRDPSGR
jgi:hypothetical protein